MGALPLHPSLVHVPLGLAVILPLVAIALTIALWRRWVPPRAFGVVVLLQAVVLGAGFAAYQSGEGEEEKVEGVVAEQYIEAHEEAAGRFLFGAGVSLALGAAALLVFRRERAQRWVAGAAAVATIAVAGLAVATGKPGGELVYVHGAAQAYQSAGGSGATGSAAEAPVPRADHDDDD